MLILYVLTSTGNDVYIDLTYISALFLLKTNPNAKVNIACDEESYQLIKSSNHPLTELKATFISVTTPQGSPSWKNRYVKSRMRKLISGDFLYLDGDTIVRNSLNEIFKTPCSFAATSNHNIDYPSNFDEREKGIFRINNWNLPQQNYYNAGVMFWRDTEEMQQLADLYISKWEQSSRQGIHFDQPALNSALLDWGGNICLLEQAYNAQFINDYRISFDAIIWHRYYSGGTKYPLDYFQLILDRLAQRESISDDHVAKVLSAKCVLVSRNSRNERNLVKLINKKNGVVNKVDYYRHQTSLIRRILNKLNKI